MDELIRRYQKLIQLLEEEEEKISFSLQGDLLSQYRLIIKKEKELIKEQIRTIRNQ